MNKLTMTLLLAAVIFCSACTDKQSTYRIGVSQCCSDDWREKMNEEINREAIFHDNVEVEIRSADDSNEKQIADIRYYMDNHFDAIIAAPIEAEAITPIIREAYSTATPPMGATPPFTAPTIQRLADKWRISRCLR
jgi:ABC-type sugar transport system substrate-binding protein